MIPAVTMANARRGRSYLRDIALLALCFTVANGGSHNFRSVKAKAVAIARNRGS